ncbi:MAG: hypothetical protein ACPHK8_04770 [Thermoplasmatota archaeon]
MLNGFIWPKKKPVRDARPQQNSDPWIWYAANLETVFRAARRAISASRYSYLSSDNESGLMWFNAHGWYYKEGAMLTIEMEQKDGGIRVRVTDEYSATQGTLPAKNKAKIQTKILRELDLQLARS